MADLTTYEFYTGTYYGDTVSETDFPKWLSKATNEINYLTFNNIDDDAITTFNQRIQMAVCSLMDVMYKLDKAQAQADDGTFLGQIKSRSSGGESVTYGDTATMYTKALTSDNARKALELDSIRPYLTGTGLLYAGI